MKRTTILSSAAFVLAAWASCLTAPTPAAAYEPGGRLSDRIGSREDLRDLLSDRMRGREDLRALVLDQLREREDLRDLLTDLMRGREDFRDLQEDRMDRRARADRWEGQNDFRDQSADRMQGREDLRGILQDRLERRALLRELLAEHVQRQEGRLHGLASERYENAAEEGSEATGINRDDVRDLILDRIRNSGDVDQLLEQFRDRMEGQE